jgi:hypothetical protein
MWIVYFSRNSELDPPHQVTVPTSIVQRYCIVAISSSWRSLGYQLPGTLIASMNVRSAMFNPIGQPMIPTKRCGRRSGFVDCVYYSRERNRRLLHSLREDKLSRPREPRLMKESSFNVHQLLSKCYSERRVTKRRAITCESHDWFPTSRFSELLLIPTGLDLHNGPGFQFCDFLPLANPSGISRDIIVEYFCICNTFH